MPYRHIGELAGFFLIFILEGLCPYYDPQVRRYRHALRNGSLFLLNSGIYLLVFSGLTFSAMEWANRNSAGLLNLVDAGFLEWPAGILLLDLWMYVWHMLLHRGPFLSLFHRMHHSDIEMDVTTALRFHPGEILISHLLRTGVILLIGIEPEQFLFYGFILQLSIFFHHSNLGFGPKTDRFLSLFIVSPMMHKIHHSTKKEERNSNYTSLFSFWDRLFATYTPAAREERIEFGLPVFREDSWQNVRGMLKTPFVK
ncbi:MAG TPA: sterol desaturase family protein [bacterium]|nr:sterol desaturase family protein [bacterium]